jgi:hypothetical protein
MIHCDRITRKGVVKAGFCTENTDSADGTDLHRGIPNMMQSEKVGMKTRIQRNSEKTLEKFRKQNERSGRGTFACLKEQKTYKMFSSATEFRTCSPRSEVLSKFFVSLDFFFVTFFCIKTKESKVIHQWCRRRQLAAPTERSSFSSEYVTATWGTLKNAKHTKRLIANPAAGFSQLFRKSMSGCILPAWNNSVPGSKVLY